MPRLQPSGGEAAVYTVGAAPAAGGAPVGGGAHRSGRLRHMDGFGDIRFGRALVTVAQYPGQGGHGQAAVHQPGGGTDAHSVGRQFCGGDPGLGQGGAHEAGELCSGEGGGQVRVRCDGFPKPAAVILQAVDQQAARVISVRRPVRRAAARRPPQSGGGPRRARGSGSLRLALILAGPGSARRG